MVYFHKYIYIYISILVEWSHHELDLIDFQQFLLNIDYTQTSDNDKIISSSTKVLITSEYKTNKFQPSSKATTPQSKQTTRKTKPAARANTSKIEQPKNRESRSKTR